MLGECLSRVRSAISVSCKSVTVKSEEGRHLYSLSPEAGRYHRPPMVGTTDHVTTVAYTQI